MLNKHITLEVQVLMGKLLQCMFTQHCGVRAQLQLDYFRVMVSFL
jgi:hypothetical protein